MPSQDRFSKLAGGVAAAATAAALLLFLAACSMTVDKQGEVGHKKDNVDIQTPLGGLKVRGEGDPKEIGLPVYAGARQAPEDGKHESPGGNVSLNLPGFGMKVVAASYESDDSTEKILAFYRKELKSYGEVTECKGDIDLKGDDISNQEIRCKEGLSAEARDKVGLAAGKGASHRIVSVEPKGKGSKFSLVYLRFESEKKNTM